MCDVIEVRYMFSLRVMSIKNTGCSRDRELSGQFFYFRRHVMIMSQE